MKETETLKLEELAGYQPFRINPLEIEYNGAIHTLDGVSGGWMVSLRQAMRAIDNVHVETIKPLLIPLSELTKEQWIEVFKAGSNLDPQEIHIGNWAVAYDPVFIARFYYGICEFRFKDDFNQLAAFTKLYQLHADLHGLVDRGLALNKLQYQNPPSPKDKEI